MKVIAGLDDDFDGRAHVHEGIKVGYLPQVSTHSLAELFRLWVVF